jgi:hypothetical protein
LFKAADLQERKHYEKDEIALNMQQKTAKKNSYGA